MKTLCYYLSGDFATALDKVIFGIPCWVWTEGEETRIYCREEDAAFVERTLADYV